MRRAREALLGVDVGTTLVKALVLDERGEQVAAAQRPTPWMPTPSGAEISPATLYECVQEAVGEALVRAGVRRVAGVGVTGMAESLALLGEDGQEVVPTIAWHDGRGSDRLAAFDEEFGAERFAGITGLPLTEQPSLFKLEWMRRHLPGFASARRALSVPEYVAARLGGDPAAERSLASRTGLYDVTARRWSEELAEWAGISLSLFEAALPAGGRLGPVAGASGALAALNGAAIAVGGHDHLCAAAGAGVVEVDEVLNSCGTAEVYLRGLHPLDVGAIRHAVSTGVSVGCHVVPGFQVAMAGQPYGLVLGPIRDELGGGEKAGRTRRTGRTGRSPASEPTVASDAGDVPFRYDPVTGAAAFGEEAAARPSEERWQLALAEVARRSIRRYLAVESLDGVVHRVVMTGGWAQLVELVELKGRQLPGLVVSALTEAGARGAALFGGVAAGWFDSPREFPPAEVRSWAPPVRS